MVVHDLAVRCMFIAFGVFCGLTQVGCISPAPDPLGEEPAGNATCSEGKTPCDGACADLAVSGEHCGACGNVCSDGAFCVQGSCATACPGGQTRCGDSCAQLDRDSDHCGNCDRECPAGEVCSSGRCESACGGSTPLQCDGSCSDPLTDRNNCGTCGNVCAADLVCSEGRCSDECGGSSPDRCDNLCVDTQRAVGFCGDCDTTCSGGDLCVAGSCQATCPDAEPNRCGLSCVDSWSDPYHCGACNRACSRTQVCSEGSCQASCSGTTPLQCGDRCVDPETDPAACGGCGNVCGNDQVCSRGVCEDACRTGEAACGGSCVDLSADARYCGACGSSCVPGAVCAHGICSNQCPAERPTACGSQCVIVDKDPEHCGECNNRCASPQSCRAGKCRCPAERPNLCGNVCVDRSSDEANCGACGETCGERQQCVEGACRNTIGVVETGWQGTCALYGSSEVRCWGSSHQMTGIAAPVSGNVINWIGGFSGPVVDLDVGGNHACALLASGGVECWGAGGGSMYLLGTNIESTVIPVSAELPEGAATALWLNYNHAAALLNDGSLWTWGPNSWGELAHEGSAPAPAEGLLASPVGLGIGQTHMCGRLSDDDATVQCWGLHRAVHGGGSATPIAPTTIAGLAPPDVLVDLSRSITAGDNFTCAIAGPGDVACWGSNSHGQLGVAPVDLSESATPLAISGLPARAVDLVAGQAFACALLDNGELWCWGQHGGAGSPWVGSGAEKILGDVVTASAEANLGFARTANGDWYSWGASSHTMSFGRLTGETHRPGPCCEW